MSDIYPHRRMTFLPSINPGDHEAAVTGDPVDFSSFAQSAACFQVVVTAAAGPVTFTFETAEENPASPGTPLAASWTEMGNCQICDGAVPTEDGEVVVTPAAEPFLTDGFQVCTICLCCPKMFVRAKSSAAGSYSVMVLGKSKYIHRS